MLDRKWTIYLAAALIVLSGALYLLHFTVFQDPHHIWIYFLGDLAFVPIEVLLVTLILHQLLEIRDRKMKLEKMNMVIGTFFSAAGQKLLQLIGPMVTDLQDIQEHLALGPQSPDAQMQAAVKYVHGTDFHIAAAAEHLGPLRNFLADRTDLLLRLLENPAILEHESFTDLLWAVSHLSEELQARGDLAALPESDLGHLSGDVDRAYTHLVGQWVRYMIHLRSDYPYLFSLAARTNPLRADASPVVR